MLSEFVFVLSQSKRTQFLLVFGLLLSAAILVLGEYMVTGLELKSLPPAFEDVIKEKLLRQYDKAAWLIVLGTLAGGVRLYLKDRKRLLG